MQKHQATLLKDLRSILNYHNQLGIEGYPPDAGIGAFVEKTIECKRAVSVETPSRKRETAPVDKKGKAGTIEEIADEVRICTSCNLHQKRILPVPGSGGETVKIFIVGGWLTGLEGRHLPEGTVFGLEEDAMVSRMLSAIHLKREDAFLSNVIKCGIPPTVQPVVESIHACSSYLYRQIAAVSPTLVCTMGMIATRLLLDIQRPLSQLRGRFYTITTSEKKEVPLLPTYHPTFLLQNPEMKKATWVDLQLIEKELKKIAGQ